MTVETATYTSQLNTSYPAVGDPKSEGDDHIRLTKSAIKATWPNLTAAAVTASTAELNHVTGVTSSIQAQINTKAPAASPTFTGTAALPSTTSIGTVTAAEIAYLSGVTSGLQTQINAKAPTASPELTGTPTAPTATAGTSTTQIATCAFVAATAMSPILPGQAGNGGSVLVTDGANASWARSRAFNGF